jgi:hypothetical protein
MDQDDVHLAMKLVLQQELTLVTMQGFEVLNRIDLKWYSEATALADSMAERARFASQLLRRCIAAELTEVATKSKN